MDNLTSTQRLLVATAWVDGRLEASEAEFLRRVLANGQVTVEQIEACLQAPTITLGDVLPQLPEQHSGEDVMREVLRMCFVDGVLAHAELDLMVRLSSQLGVSDQRLAVLRQEISQESPLRAGL